MGSDLTSIAERRAHMVARHLKDRGISDPGVLEAMSVVPRERFIPAELAEFAYDDGALPIGQDQTISQPYVVALMAQALHVGSTDRVLEIGTGSGYGAAVLAQLAKHVTTIERLQPLADSATQRLDDLGYTNVEVVCADGTLGWASGAPYDAIVVTAGGPDVPAALVEQLTDTGRLVVPVGRHRKTQRLMQVTRHGTETTQSDLGGVRFVPLIGDQGW